MDAVTISVSRRRTTTTTTTRCIPRPLKTPGVVFFFFSNLLTDDPEPDEVAGDRSGADLALVHPGVLQADRADPEEPSGGGAPLSRPVAGRASLLLLLLLLPRAPRASLREDRPGVEPPVGGVGVQAGADDVQVVPADPGNLRSSRK